MAPARMISFINKHAVECDVCLADPDLQYEIEKIKETVLPESKVTKAVSADAEKRKKAAEEEEKISIYLRKLAKEKEYAN